MNDNTINDAVTIAGGEGTLLANRYRIVRQLGQGGMGSVWLVEDTQLDNKPFAVKMLPSILVANKRAYRQLKDEALVAMRLVHPNIVQIRAFEGNNGNPFLVMDYIDGQTLDDYLAEHTGTTDVSSVAGGIPEAEVVRILRPIADALDYAHGEGVVHRDVKPANVMIRKDGHPFILDFGIAREIQETMTRMTGNLVIGTLLYMSPEQLNGASPKPAQDVYSFAAMVYECLKGEPPFVRGQIEYQILNNPPPPLDIPTNGPSARGSGTLAASVMAGLAKKPENRPPTCAEVLWEDGSVRASCDRGWDLRCEADGGHKMIQLWKDGPYWAETNIGAENPWDFGYYFWWGDIVGYKCEPVKVNGAGWFNRFFSKKEVVWVASDGSSSGCSFYEDKIPTFGKDNPTLQREGWITTDGVLVPKHDAAHVQWGDGWRMPTKQELNDLYKKCDWAWTNMEGVSGYVVRGKGDYASANIFLPAAGYGYGTSLGYAGSYGRYWSSVPSSGYYDAWSLDFYSSSLSTPNGSRCRGRSVRPVQGFTK